MTTPIPIPALALVPRLEPPLFIDVVGEVVGDIEDEEEESDVVVDAVVLAGKLVEAVDVVLVEKPGPIAPPIVVIFS